MRLMNKGLRIAEPSISGAVGAAIGLLGGPPGAVIGGFVGGAFSTAVKKLGSEIDKRFMGPREEARVGAVCALGAAEIVERVNAGEKLREDGFFEEGEAGRSDAEEVWESLLSKCQREASERKLRYMGHLFASLAFDDTIELDMAHQLIFEAEQLTHRQLCILRLCVTKESFDLRRDHYVNELEEDHSESHGIGPNVYQVLYECYDLYRRGLVHFGGSAVLAFVRIVPSAMEVYGLGAVIYNVMRLEVIPYDDVAKVAERLR